MIETIPSLQQVALRASMGRAAITLAHREAEKAIKRRLAASRPPQIPRQKDKQ